jgi:hypothetical protein
MIGIIWTFLTGNKIARTIGMVVMAVLGVLTFGAVKKREGAQGQKAKQAEAQAKAEAKAHERMNDADLGIGATDSERIERLRGFAAKHGNGQAKGKGG